MTNTKKYYFVIRFWRLILPIILLIISFGESYSQLSGTYTVGSAQTYASLTNNSGIFEAINNYGLSGNLIINISSNLSEIGTHSLNQWIEFGSGGYYVLIKPQNSNNKIITGNSSSALIRFNGCDRVQINGNYNNDTGINVTKSLRFKNYNSNSPVFLFINDASYNLLTNLIIEGCDTNQYNVADRGGVVVFSGTNGITGNDFNIIKYCDIRDMGDVSSYPAYSIVSYSSVTNASLYNSDNQIVDNNIYNFWADGKYCGGIVLTLGSGNNWVIKDNSFYQTSDRISSSSFNAGWNVIFINSTGINNCTIINNYIGGNSPQLIGNPWRASSNAYLQMACIRAFVGSNLFSNIQGNRIGNISLTGKATSSGQQSFSGIFINAGSVNVGNEISNFIGNENDTGNIKIFINGSGNYSHYIRGIDHRSEGDISNNIIGSISVMLSPDLTSLIGFDLISKSGISNSDVLIRNNLIGSTNVVKSIKLIGRMQNSVLVTGINVNLNTDSVTLYQNTISNIYNDALGNTNSVLNGIRLIGSTDILVSNNSILNLETMSTSSSQNPAYISLNGINNMMNSTRQKISGNIIGNLINLNTSQNNSYINGTSISGNNSAGLITNNRIYNLVNLNSGNSPGIWGLNAYSGSWDCINNQIKITNEQVMNIEGHIHNLFPYKLTNNLSYSIPLIAEKDKDIIKNVILNNSEPYNKIHNSEMINTSLQGIHDQSGGYWNYYYNSILIGGNNNTSLRNSYCYLRSGIDPTTVQFRNNLFCNIREGDGKSLVISNQTGNPLNTGWDSTASNYNVFIGSDSIVAEWGIENYLNFLQWKDISRCDKQSYNILTDTSLLKQLFVGSETGNLNINSNDQSAWIVSGKGIALQNVNYDYEGNQRHTSVSGGVTDIGSDEFISTPPGNPIALCDNLPAGGLTTNYFIYGRKICSIDWGAGGTSYPALVDVRYYSGVNPPSVQNNFHSSSYWQITVNGNLSGATYDIIFYFGDNETYTITNPDSNTCLASYSNQWIFYPRGSGIYQSDLDWQSLKIKTRGLNSFSVFSLTDQTNPLPVVNTIQTSEYKLFQNYPNPFNSSTTIEFNLSENNYVELKIFNILGQEIETLLKSELKAGDYKLSWNAGKYPSGIYFYKIITSVFIKTNKMLLIR